MFLSDLLRTLSTSSLLGLVYKPFDSGCNVNRYAIHPNCVIAHCLGFCEVSASRCGFTRVTTTNNAILYKAIDSLPLCRLAIMLSL